MANFQHIGKHVGFGDVAISTEDAEQFRQTALRGSRIKQLSYGEYASLVWTSSYASGVLSDALGDYEVDESAYYAKSTAGREPDFWRSVVTFARYNQKNANTKIYNIYGVESFQGEVVSAIRTVRIIRNLSQLAFNSQGEPYEDVYSRQRKVFEVAMLPQDVEHVALLVDRIMRRQQAMAG